jgi:hypothetical protein
MYLVAIDRERVEDYNIVALKFRVATWNLHWQFVVYAGDNLEIKI